MVLSVTGEWKALSLQNFAKYILEGSLKAFMSPVFSFCPDGPVFIWTNTCLLDLSYFILILRILSIVDQAWIESEEEKLNWIVIS